MRLYGHPDSGHAFKVRAALCHAGVEHDYQVVDIWRPLSDRSPDFQAASRFGEVPCLVDDDGVARVQSNAILLHLMDAHAVGDATQRVRSVEWLCWEANKIGMCLPQLRVAARFEPDAFTPGALAWLRSRYDSDVARLEIELSDGRAFITGEHVSVADFSLCGYLVFADEAELPVPDGVSGWLARMARLPGWQAPYELMAG